MSPDNVFGILENTARDMHGSPVGGTNATSKDCFSFGDMATNTGAGPVWY